MAQSLNGGTTKPLTNSALSCLEAMARAPIPAAQVNPGIIDRLTRRDVVLADVVTLPSPYESHRGRPVEHLRINAAGLAALAAAGPFVNKPFS